MNKKQIIILAALAVFIIAGIIFGVVLKPDKGRVNTEPAATSTEGQDINQITEFKDLPEFTGDVSKDLEETQANEVIDVITSPEKDTKLGGYTITASKNGYSPSLVTVRQGDIVRMTLKSEDANYDLFIPAMSIHITALEGEEKQTSFRVSQGGTFRFECRDFCPRGGEIFGRLTVKPKQP